MSAWNAFPRDKHPFYSAPFYPYCTSTAPVPTAPVPQKYFISGQFASTQTPEIPYFGSTTQYSMNRKTIRFILAVSAEHRRYNNTLYNNLEEKVSGLTEPRKENKLKSQRFRNCKTWRHVVLYVTILSCDTFPSAMPLKNSITNPAVGSPRRSSRPERVSPVDRGIRNDALQTFS